MGAQLIILDSPYRSGVEPVVDYIDEVCNRYKEGVILPIRYTDFR